MIKEARTEVDSRLKAVHATLHRLGMEEFGLRNMDSALSRIDPEAAATLKQQVDQRLIDVQSRMWQVQQEEVALLNMGGAYAQVEAEIKAKELEASSEKEESLTQQDSVKPSGKGPALKAVESAANGTGK